MSAEIMFTVWHSLFSFMSLDLRTTTGTLKDFSSARILDMN